MEKDSTIKEIKNKQQTMLFLSHKADRKKEVKDLKDKLEKEYNISSFLAHEDIEPNKKWVEEIEKNLEEMTCLIAIISKGYHESPWTNQEIGFAKARRIPILSIKFENDAPKGFIADKQALSCNWKDEGYHHKIIKELLKEKVLPQEQSSLLYKKINAIKLLKSSPIKVYFNKGDTTRRQNYKTREIIKENKGFALIVYTYHFDYSYKTLCYLYNKNTFIALIRIAHKEFKEYPLGHYEMEKEEIKDYLPKSFIFLNDDFFSKIDSEGKDLSMEETLKEIFNDISLPRVAKKYSDKKVFELLLSFKN